MSGDDIERHVCGHTADMAPCHPAKPQPPVASPVQPPPNARSLVLADLDRCEHSRHVRDLCWECSAKDGDVPNAGNPHLDDVIGYALDGPFTVRDLLGTIGRDGTTWSSRDDRRLTVDPCTHDTSLTGVDTTTGPGKVWRCEDCGKTGTQAELADDRANVYAPQLREERDALAVEPTDGYRTSLHAALAELDAVKEQLDGAIRPQVLDATTPEPARPWIIQPLHTIGTVWFSDSSIRWKDATGFRDIAGRPVFVISAGEAG